jgi:hypothetical protein
MVTLQELAASNAYEVSRSGRERRGLTRKEAPGD